MANQSHLILIAMAAVTPTACAVYVFLSRERAYAAWAKISSIMASIAGLAWGACDWAAKHSQDVLCLPPGSRGRLVGIAAMFGGVAVGLMLSILIARPYEKRIDRFAAGSR